MTKDNQGRVGSWGETKKKLPFPNTQVELDAKRDALNAHVILFNPPVSLCNKGYHSLLQIRNLNPKEI